MNKISILLFTCDAVGTNEAEHFNKKALGVENVITLTCINTEQMLRNFCSDPCLPKAREAYQMGLAV